MGSMMKALSGPVPFVPGLGGKSLFLTHLCFHRDKSSGEHTQRFIKIDEEPVIIKITVFCCSKVVIFIL